MVPDDVPEQGGHSRAVDGMDRPPVQRRPMLREVALGGVVRVDRLDGFPGRQIVVG